MVSLTFWGWIRMMIDEIAIKIRLVDGTDFWLIKLLCPYKFDQWVERNISEREFLVSKDFYLAELEWELQNKNIFEDLIWKDKIRYRFKFEKSLTSICVDTDKIVSIQHTRLENLANWSRWEKL